MYSFNANAVLNISLKPKTELWIYPENLKWCLENLNIVCFAPSLYLENNFRDKGNLKQKETQHFIPIPIILKTTEEGIEWEKMQELMVMSKSLISLIRNPELFVPLVKVINSMPEQNLHRLNFHKILKIWLNWFANHDEDDVCSYFGPFVGASEIVQYRAKLEWWIKFQIEQNIWTWFLTSFDTLTPFSAGRFMVHVIL